jgi:hypothetical protein
MAKLVLPGAAKQIDESTPPPRLKVAVINGDLSFIEQPLLLGHYRSLNLTGTEYVMNRLIGGAMETSLQMGLYPVAIGTHQVFTNRNVDQENPWRTPRPEAVIVAGLGEEGKLRASDLLQTVRQATLAWAQRELESQKPPFALAATMIGSGGLGMSVGQSAQVITQAVLEANERLAESNSAVRRLNKDRKEKDEPLLDEWPTISDLFLIELYLDRAREAWRALHVQASAGDAFDLLETVQTGQAALPRPIESSYRGADYDFMSAISGTDGTQSVISFTLDTKRARAEVHAQSAQTELLRALLRDSWSGEQNRKIIGRTLFKLLVPIDMESFLGGSSELQIELDTGTAGIPWELLDSGGDDNGTPWAIRAKLLRKLRTADFRLQPPDASAEDQILIIGEPKCDPNLYPPLPAARREAQAVFDLLTEPGGVKSELVVGLIASGGPQSGPDACQVTTTLITDGWRIVHIAGHGEPPERIGPKPQAPGDPPQQDGPPRGVVLSDGLFLGPDLIQRMRPVPELVFLNCCHLAARNEGQLLKVDESLFGRPYDRAVFASGIAEALIRAGVRCVIAAGWAVDDKPAEVFATKFYRQILDGRRFLDAVSQARSAAREAGKDWNSNTWAAYQCYGDPDWVFRRGPGDAQRPPIQSRDEFAGIASQDDLLAALKTLEVRSKFHKAPRREQAVKIRTLEARFAQLWRDNGAVLEAFADAFAAAKESGDAIRFYESALAAGDGGASMRASEQLGNIRVRLALDRLVGSAKIAGEASSKAIFDQARAEIESARNLLESLAASARTVERLSLCGSAWKRFALVERLAGLAEEENAAIQKAYDCYAEAEQLARAQRASNFFYPAMNRMALEIVLRGHSPEWEGLKAKDLDEVRANLEATIKKEPDFWSLVGRVELALYEALARNVAAGPGSGRLAAALDGLLRAYDDVHNRVNSTWMWSSVSDQARFLLERYAQYAPAPEEKNAANKLLDRLQQMAAGTWA